MHEGNAHLSCRKEREGLSTFSAFIIIVIIIVIIVTITAINRNDRQSFLLSNKISPLATVSHSRDHSQFTGYHDNDDDNNTGYHDNGRQKDNTVEKQRKKDQIKNVEGGAIDEAVVDYSTCTKGWGSTKGRGSRKGRGSTKERDEYGLAVKSKMATRPLPPIPTNTTPKESERNITTPTTPTNITTPTTPTNITLYPPPPPPSTPQGGVGVPPPPPPPPPMGRVIGPGIGNNRPKTKRVNWDKVQGTNLEGTIWREVRLDKWQTDRYR